MRVFFTLFLSLSTLSLASSPNEHSLFSLDKQEYCPAYFKSKYREALRKSALSVGISMIDYFRQSGVIGLNSFIREFVMEMATKPIRSEYNDEKILYFKKAALERCQLFCINNLFYDSKLSLYSSRDKEMVVIDSLGNIFAHHKISGKLHHSSFFSGEPVAFAGMMKFKNGKSFEIELYSGHYHPGESELKNYRKITADIDNSFHKECRSFFDVIRVKSNNGFEELLFLDGPFVSSGENIVQCKNNKSYVLLDRWGFAASGEFNIDSDDLPCFVGKSVFYSKNGYLYYLSLEKMLDAYVEGEVDERTKIYVGEKIKDNHINISFCEDFSNKKLYLRLLSKGKRSLLKFEYMLFNADDCSYRLYDEDEKSGEPYYSNGLKFVFGDELICITNVLQPENTFKVEGCRFLKSDIKNVFYYSCNTDDVHLIVSVFDDNVSLYQICSSISDDGKCIGGYIFETLSITLGIDNSCLLNFSFDSYKRVLWGLLPTGSGKYGFYKWDRWGDLVSKGSIDLGGVSEIVDFYDGYPIISRVSPSKKK